MSSYSGLRLINLVNRISAQLKDENLVNNPVAFKARVESILTDPDAKAPIDLVRDCTVFQVERGAMSANKGLIEACREGDLPLAQVMVETYKAVASAVDLETGESVLHLGTNSGHGAPGQGFTELVFPPSKPSPSERIYFF